MAGKKQRNGEGVTGRWGEFLSARRPFAPSPRLDGFTLLELMIVITIIIILAAIALPQYQKSVKQAREAVLRDDLNTMRKLIDHRHDSIAVASAAGQGLRVLDLLFEQRGHYHRRRAKFLEFSQHIHFTGQRAGRDHDGVLEWDAEVSRGWIGSHACFPCQK